MIFRTAIKEIFNGVVPDRIKERAKNLIIKMTDAEKRWTKYIAKDVLGYSDNVIDIFVEAQANSVCSNLLIDPIYPKVDDANNPLRRVLLNHLPVNNGGRRGGVFEGNIIEYSKNSVALDF